MVKRSGIVMLFHYPSRVPDITLSNMSLLEQVGIEYDKDVCQTVAISPYRSFERDLNRMIRITKYQLWLKSRPL